MTTSTDFLSHLNPAQRRAVEHFCGPLLVVAGAGSGKTRALTYRIANLIRHHRVDPENILAVTFTNKAAQEMKERIELIFAQELAQERFGRRLELLPEYEQNQLRSQVYRRTTKLLWIGTFHSLFARILRLDINKYQDEKSRTWKRNFSIFDESDVQSLIKNIVTKQLNLNDKKFEPRKVRYAISNAKNQGLNPEQLLRENPDYRTRVIAEIYNEYQAQLSNNNALDFDDLILIPLRLFQQNESILGYWHSQFHHILVDEYQDTNRIQYNLIRLLTTNGEEKKEHWNWQNRSIFVVGDADQSIYSFRQADFTILLGFQTDFGDNLPDDDTRTMVKLEENYRSRENILEAANHLIANNSQRIDKVLRATRGYGEHLYCHKASNEQEEARFCIHKMLQLKQDNPELNWGDLAILYRMNAQSRAFEDILRQNNIPYNIIGGLKFYDRKEIKDTLAYLRVLVNPADTVSLLRIINTPRRGIGQSTVNNLISASQELGMPLWEILIDQTSVNTLAGRAAKKVNQFAQMMQQLQVLLANWRGSQILAEVFEKSGYIEDLKTKGTDEAENRLENIAELYNAILQFEEENETDRTLQAFLESAALSSDLDNLEAKEQVSLMTLHSAKGLEFPIVFLVGLEQGLFPHARSLNDPFSLEEERRLCYVGITRAQEQLFLTYTRERRLWGGSREPAIPSQFLSELPQDLLNANSRQQFSVPAESESTSVQTIASNELWENGDHVFHPEFGEGRVVAIFGNGKKSTIAVKFFELGATKILPTVATMQKL